MFSQRRLVRRLQLPVALGPHSSRHRQEHRVDQSLLFAPLWVERGEGIGEAQEVGSALVLGFEQSAQCVGAAACL